MPFDGTGFPGPKDGNRAAATDNLVTILIVAIAALLLVTPISIAALGDIMRVLHPS